MVTSGKFARVCVEIDLSKPLPPDVRVDGAWLKFVYEGIPSICRYCWHARHSTEICHLKAAVEAMEDDQRTALVSVGVNNTPRGTQEEERGSWMIPKRHPARKHGSQRTGKQRHEAKKNQFAALAVENVVTAIEMMEDEEVPTQIDMSVKELGVTIERNNIRIAPHQPQCATPSASDMEGAPQLGISTGVEVSSPLVNSQVPLEVNSNSVNPNPECNIADPSSNSVNTTNEGILVLFPWGKIVTTHQFRRHLS
ncbi:hypothetical protein LINGRAHAP2_LOCUS1797 [Linum grandiflorum]